MKLKPCPFCGKSPVVYWPNPLVCCIQCKGCLAEGPLEATERGAQIKWNKRAANTSSAGTTVEAPDATAGSTMQSPRESVTL